MVYKFISIFRATCEKPGSHFDLARLRQKSDESLRDYIRRFCDKKMTIPNIPDQQVISAFMGGLRNDDLVHEIGHRNRNLDLTAADCFHIADEYASGESAVSNIRGNSGRDRQRSEASGS